ncbi:MAG: hypothetical protein IPK39_19630 [Sulfuritalea sp.]|nr:hypothetical protein [Sulfuritalea sp.]
MPQTASSRAQPWFSSAGAKPSYPPPATAQITWALKDETGNDLDYKPYGPPFLLSSEEMFGNVRNLTYRYMPPGTLFPTEVPQYDNWVIREALHNCIAHQDYSLGGRISVTEKPGELIFTNLGDFLPRDVDEVIRRDARRRFIAIAGWPIPMVDLQMIDTRGGVPPHVPRAARTLLSLA